MSCFDSSFPTSPAVIDTVDVTLTLIATLLEGADFECFPPRTFSPTHVLLQTFFPSVHSV